MEQPEGRALDGNLEKALISVNVARQDRDKLFATWRDVLHESLQVVGTGEMIPMIHQVINSIDEYLRRSKHDGVW